MLPRFKKSAECIKTDECINDFVTKSGKTEAEIEGLLRVKDKAFIKPLILKNSRCTTQGCKDNVLKINDCKIHFRY